MGPRRSSTLVYLLGLVGGVVILVLFVGFPLFWMGSTALKPSPEIYRDPLTLLPQDPTFDALVRLFTRTKFLLYFMNTGIVTVFSVLITLGAAIPAAYSLARFKFREQRIIGTLILFTYMFAPILIIIPFYVMMNTLNLVDTRIALVLAYITYSLPFSVWMLRSFFRAIPIELEEVASIDGANQLSIVTRILLPLALPGIIATAIFAFILAWNDYLFARVLITSTARKTLVVGVYDLYRAAVVDWSLLMSAGVMITVPALVLFGLVQRHLITGWGAGGVKG